MSRTILIAALLMMPALLAAEDKATPKETARVIDVDTGHHGMPDTRANAPFLITNAKELAVLVTDKAAQERILKEIDLGKENLLYFAWAGSGQDRLSVSEGVNEKGEIVFTYKQGRTRDLRSHFRLFAIAKDAKWKVVS